MEYLFIYLLQICDIFSEVAFAIGAFFAIFIICFFITGALTGFQFENFDKQSWDCDISKETAKSASIFFKKAIIISGILFLFFIFIPTKQTMLMLGGTYYGKKVYKTIVTDEKIKKIDEIINLELDKYIKELKNDDINYHNGSKNFRI